MKKYPTPEIYVLSRGRIGNQKTLQSFKGLNRLEGLITLVTPESEVAGHSKQEYADYVNIVGAPEGLHLERKRRAVTKTHLRIGKSPFLMMLDDDLVFQAWNGTSFVSARKFPQVWEDVIVNKVPSVLHSESVSALTFPIPYFAKDFIEQNGMFKSNTLICAVNYWNAEHAMEVFDREPMANVWAEDNWMTLALLTNGRKTGMSYYATRGTDFKTKGGAGAYRSDLDVQVSLLRLMRRFPGLVSRKDVKDPDNSHAHSHLKVDFKSAASYAGLKSRLDQLGEIVFARELKRAGLTLKEYERMELAQRTKGPLAKQPAKSYLNLTGSKE